MKINKKKGQLMTFSGRKAFTLIELLVVIAIIMLLAGMMVGVGKFSSMAAKKSKASSSIQHIKNALLDYKFEYGSYPECNDANGKDLDIIVSEAISSNVITYLPPNFRFKDPWGVSYQYKHDSKNAELYSIWSCGPDMLTVTEEDKWDDIKE